MEFFSRRHFLMSPLLLVFVINTIFSSNVTTRHHIRHHRDRFKRQQGAHLYLPGSYVTDGGDGEDAGPWMDWSTPSPCSRTCGGGVSSQYRECQPGYACQGPTNRHFSCNTQDCPDTGDFRSQQCSEFDSSPFEGVLYQWIPYTKAPNPCELNCMPRGERFYFRHRAHVTDGTRCNDESLDVCVAGKCQPVGCDMMLGSHAREDKCRQCGGDGTTCNTITGILDMQDLQVGYNDILLIPAGATNIRVEEVAPSNNYLAVRNTSGHYHLNGNWRIDFPRSMEFAGCKFHYERYPQGFSAPDKITCLGPTDEAIFIVLLYQDRNVGVDYEYSVPRSIQHNTDTETYAWTFDQFSPCSATCGGGIQFRNVSCAGRRTLEPADRNLCDVNNEPVSSQRCGEIPCEPQWVVQPWGKCSSPCGEGGVQIRQVLCEQVITNGLPTLVDEQECQKLSSKPPVEQPCNKGMVCAQWHTGPWKPCDHLCGGGKETREVTCFRKENGTIDVLDEEECEAVEEKPEDERPCNMRPCEGVDWVTTEWTGCEHKCGLQNETRKANCATAKGETFPNELCEQEKLPVLIRQCKTTNTSCEHEWYASQWSECSATCGKGVQTRKVFCASVSEDGLKKVEDDKCDASKKYVALQNCTAEEKVCGGEWFSGPWSECSKECGGGDRSRKVVCLRDNKVVNASECSSENIIFSSESCNTHSCTEDTILPVDVTKPVDVSEPAEDVDDEYEIVEDDECEDGVWVDVEDEPDVTSPLDTSETTSESMFDSSTETSVSGQSSETSFSLDDLMLSDATAFTDESQSTISGSGDEEITSVSTEKSMSSETVLSSGSTGDVEISLSTDEGSGDSTVESEESTTVSSETSSSDASSSDISSESSSSAESSTDASSASESSIDASSASESSTDVSSSSIGSTTESSVSTETSSVSSSESSESSSSSSETTEFTSESTTDFTSTTEFSSSFSSDSSSLDQSTSSWAMSSESTTDVSSSSSSLLSTTELSSSSPTDEGIVGESLEGAEQETEKSSLQTEVTESTVDFTGSTASSVSESGSSELSSESPETTTEFTGSTESTIEFTGSTESTSEFTGSTDSTTEFTGSTESTTEFTGSTESTTEFTGSTESTIEFTGSTEFDIWSSTSESSSSTELWETTPFADVMRKKQRMCKRKKRKNCKETEYGCCLDKITPAQGPFDKGCPTPKTCKETKYGCCEDGVSPALGKKYKGCPSTHCEETLFGCCPDKKTAAKGNNKEDCPPPPPACLKSKYGCCKDNVTKATGPKGKGCKKEEVEKMPTTTAAPTAEEKEDCSNTTYGCCPDGAKKAEGEYFQGCDIFKENCTESYFKCCPDGVTSAQGPNYRGCKTGCETNPYGCCEDGITPAHGYNREGCCLSTPYGCCPDNIVPAQGPNLEGCGCQYSPYRCCPDNVTAARGHNNEGCGCQYTPHGCCPDSYTPAEGPDYQGCLCHTFQFGCCPDGITNAKGPHQQGCGCRNTEFGCCSDDQTPAKGANFEGCGCDSSKYGCCPDGVSEAQGENFEGCENVPVNLQASCTLEKERGSCRNYTVKWFFDMEYGGCSRFWYGGCDGNGNRFRSKEECQSVCVEPQGYDKCSLPKVAGPCEGYYPMWFYDKDRNHCAQFVYGGCLGNNNRFETREECSQICVKDSNVDACEQPREEGPCRGNYRRWYYDKESSSCQEFIYGGCKSNNNNFPTEYACKQQCASPGRRKDHCSLPRAQGNCTAKEPRWYYDIPEKRCVPFYYSGCNGNNNNFNSKEACEADCPRDVEKDTCQLPAEVGDCANYVDRWYYDTAEKRCRQFYYGGCGGNGNNFETESACQRRCDAPQQPVAPIVTSPPDVEVEPFRSEFCLESSDTGPCRASQLRYFYDRTDGVCKGFTYGGCQGNRNNFETVEECYRHCANSQDLCTLPPVVGVCDGHYEQYYYNRSTDSCEVFSYGGCGGNYNRFEDRVTCEQRCKQTPPIVITTSRPRDVVQEPSNTAICYEPVSPGNCNESISAYYYDPVNQRCTSFTYTGCEGNANRYNSEEQCERQCGRFRGQDVCHLTKDPGPCRGYFPKYYYDSAAGRCEQFAFGGCEGNGNRFSSNEECETLCVTHEEKKPNATSSEICRLPVDQGACQGSYHKRWYFDFDRGECIAFIYSGCGGNFNRFKSFQTCLDFCKEFLIRTEPPNEIDEGEREPHPCQSYFDECPTLRCPYGIEAYVDENQCNRCRCHNPCNGIICEEGTQCAIDLNRNRTTGQDPDFIAVCREMNKVGQCPELPGSDSNCEQECRNDADCTMDLKCCSMGCGTACIVPVVQPIDIPAELVTSAYLPAYTEPPQAGYYAPQVDQEIFEPEVRAGEGDYATLRCSVRGNPTPAISWSKGNLVIDGKQPRFRILLDQSLQIITLHKTDSGIYLCTADNSIGQPLRKEIKLEVTDSAPHPAAVLDHEESPSVVASLGHPATLNCYAVGFPFPAVTWWKDDSLIPLKTSQFEVRKDYSLLIHSVQLSNLGIYTCQAYNGIGKAASWSVTVQALGPYHSTNPNEQEYLKYIIDPPEPPTTTTEKSTDRPQYPFRPQYPYRPSPVAARPTPQPYVPQPYTEPSPDIDPNEVVPQPGETDGVRLFSVPVKAQIELENHRFAVGVDVSIPCNVDGYPIPQVQWYKDGVPLNPSESIHISESNRLTLLNANLSNSGEYRCEAINQYSRSSSSTNILVEGIYIHPNCTDNRFFANCQLIVKAKYCTHKYYARFCCRSCTEAGLLPSYGPHLDINDKQSALSSNLV